MRTRPAPPVTLAFLRWDWRQAGAVLAAWQALAPVAPPSVWSNCHLLSRTGLGTAKAVVGVVALGEAQARAFVAALVARAGTDPAGRSLETASYRSAMLLEAGCADRTVLQCHLAGQSQAGQLPRQPYAAKSDFFNRPLSAAGIAAVLAGVERRQARREWAEGGVAFDAFGGAIADVPRDATAFSHRDALFSAQYTAAWAVPDPPATVSGNLSWLREFHSALRPYATGGAYQNYADAELTDYPAAYWGANYPRLQRVKSRYDPNNLFNFPQAVRPV